jgi:riboflavin synthase alpha subunit
VGGLIEGPFGTTVSTRSGTVTSSSTLTAHKGYKVTWKTGIEFTGVAVGDSITINGTGNTVETLDSSTILYVTNNPGNNTTAVPYSAPVPYTYPSATTPGVLNKKE